MDKLYFVVGKGVVWLIIFSIAVALAYLLWISIFRYFWYIFKRLLLPINEDWIQDWFDTIKVSDDWRANIKIFRKGKWFIWFSPNSKYILNRIRFGRIK